MSEDDGGASPAPLREGKYARIERERRFLLAAPPPDLAASTARRMSDRYLTGTRLRLRQVEHLATGAREYKLTQKIPADRPGAVQGLITNTYLSLAEYAVLSALPAAELSKVRFSVPPLGIDVFDPPLDGLVLAEVEFSTDAAALAFAQPAASVAEVTSDGRFTGGSLARSGRSELAGWLAGFGVALRPGRPRG